MKTWEDANPYDETCDVERCAWMLLKRNGECPHCSGEKKSSFSYDDDSGELTPEFP